jgi:hypothetical protein
MSLVLNQAQGEKSNTSPGGSRKMVMDIGSMNMGGGWRQTLRGILTGD